MANWDVFRDKSDNSGSYNNDRIITTVTIEH